jgi:hypothetical protein
MICLRDDELGIVMAAAAPIDRSRRDAFLREVAAELGKLAALGPGVIARTCAAVQRRHLDVVTGLKGPRFDIAPKARGVSEMLPGDRRRYNPGRPRRQAVCNQ